MYARVDNIIGKSPERLFSEKRGDGLPPAWRIGFDQTGARGEGKGAKRAKRDEGKMRWRLEYRGAREGTAAEDRSSVPRVAKPRPLLHSGGQAPREPAWKASEGGRRRSGAHLLLLRALNPEVDDTTADAARVESTVSTFPSKNSSMGAHVAPIQEDRPCHGRWWPLLDIPPAWPS